MKTRYFILIFTFLNSSFFAWSQKEGWTDEYKSIVIKNCKSDIKDYDLTEEESSDFCSCYQQKIVDSLDYQTYEYVAFNTSIQYSYKQFYNICLDCEKRLKEPPLLKFLIRKCNVSMEKTEISNKDRRRFCTCSMTKITNKYSTVELRLGDLGEILKDEKTLLDSCNK